MAKKTSIKAFHLLPLVCMTTVHICHLAQADSLKWNNFYVTNLFDVWVTFMWKSVTVSGVRIYIFFFIEILYIFILVKQRWFLIVFGFLVICEIIVCLEQEIYNKGEEIRISCGSQLLFCNVLHTTFHILSHDHTRNNEIMPELCILPVQNFTQVYFTGWKNVLNKLWQSPLECMKYQPTEMKCLRRCLKDENVVFNICNRTVRPHIRMMIIIIITTVTAPSPAYRHAR